jgi:hypothetical protein
MRVIIVRGQHSSKGENERMNSFYQFLVKDTVNVDNVVFKETVYSYVLNSAA